MNKQAAAANIIASLVCSAFWGGVMLAVTHSWVSAAVTMAVCYLGTSLVVGLFQNSADPHEVGR